MSDVLASLHMFVFVEDTYNYWCGPHLLGLSGASGGDIGFPLTR